MGSVVPDLIENNLRRREDVANSIREALGSVGGRGRDVIAVLPDAAVRVVLLDFDALPTSKQEAEAVVRFRLKKSLPFDVDKAKVSYHAQTSGQGVRTIAAVALSSVIEDYEAAFQDAGYSPGLVLPSMLAALGAADASRPTLVVKVDTRTIGIAILDNNQMLLFRTLENTRGASITGEQLAEEVYPSIVFFQDTYSLNIERILISGLPESSGAAQALGAQTTAEVKELITGAQLGSARGDSVPRYRIAGVVGALIS
jgi:type IV pilus assembly protein PilM